MKERTINHRNEYDIQDALNTIADQWLPIINKMIDENKIIKDILKNRFDIDIDEISKHKNEGDL